MQQPAVAREIKAHTLFQFKTERLNFFYTLNQGYKRRGRGERNCSVGAQMSAHTHSHTLIAFIAAMTLRSDFKVLSKSNVGPTSHPVLPSPILSTYLLSTVSKEKFSRFQITRMVQKRPSVLKETTY